MLNGPLLAPGTVVIMVMLWLALVAASRWPGWRLRRWPATSDLALAGGLGLLCGAFHWRVLFTREASLPNGGGDFNSFYYPLARYAADQLQSGHLPLWNSTLHGGAPLAADFQTGLLYPPNLLAYWLVRPFDYGSLELLVIAHFWLASLTAALLWRAVGGGRAGALVAGLTYAYGGFFISHLGHPPMLAVAAWLPLLLTALYRMLRADRWSTQRRWVAVTAMILAVMILAGHPQLLLISLMVAACWSLVVVAVTPRSDSLARRVWLWMATARGAPGGPVAGVDLSRLSGRRWLTAALLGGTVCTLGVALASPVLLPALQLGRYSVRANLAYDESTAFSLRPLLLLQMLLPKAFGDGPTSYLNAIAFSGEVWAYAGVTTLALAAVGILWRPRWPVVLGLGLALLALLLMLGPATPLHGWLYRFVPGFGQVRAPGRWSVVVSLGVGWAAAGGVDTLVSLTHGANGAMRQWLGRAAGWLGLLIGALLIAHLSLTGLLLQPKDPSAPLANLLDALGWLIVLLLLLVVLALTLARQTLPGITTGALLAGLVVLDLFAAHIDFNPTTADLTSGFRHPEIVASLRGAAAVRLDSDTGTPELWQPSTAALIGVQDIAGAFNPLGLADYAAYYDLARRDRTGPLYNFLGVTHLVARPDKLPRAGALTPLVSAPSRLVLYQRAGGRPRASIIYRSRAVESSPAALAALRQPGFDPAVEVLVTGAEARSLTSATEPTAATIVESTSDSIEIEANAVSEAYLVLADPYYPGWRAEIDGQPATVVRANYAFRAVLVPAGRHQVRLIFDPPLWRLGWLLAWPALILVGLLLLWPARHPAPGSLEALAAQTTVDLATAGRGQPS